MTDGKSDMAQSCFRYVTQIADVIFVLMTGFTHL